MQLKEDEKMPRILQNLALNIALKEFGKCYKDRDLLS